jgi:geranylgeranyl diphosphate synthase type II
VFTDLKNKIDDHISQWLDSELGNSLLDEAIKYVMQSDAKRLRPILFVLLCPNPQALDIALSIECLHNTSLIADDLPCMDHASTRRGRMCVHKKYSESIALLASYQLIAYSYKLLAGCSHLIDTKEQLRLALDTMASCCAQTAQGQFYDLYPKNSTQEEGMQKTSKLFEMVFVLAWIFSKKESSQLEKVKSASRHFGCAFQIADDFKDEMEDRKLNRPNVVIELGKEKSLQLLKMHVKQLTDDLHTLGLYSEELAMFIEQMGQPSQVLSLQL